MILLKRKIRWFEFWWYSDERHFKIPYKKKSHATWALKQTSWLSSPQAGQCQEPWKTQSLCWLIPKLPGLWRKTVKTKPPLQNFDKQANAKGKKKKKVKKTNPPNQTFLEFFSTMLVNTEVQWLQLSKQESVPCCLTVQSGSGKKKKKTRLEVWWTTIPK